MLLNDPIADLVERRLYEAGQAAGYLAKAAGDATSTYALKGRLELSSSGWLLMSIPNAIVRGLFAALDVPGAELPLRDGVLNAHASIMTKDEVAKIGPTINEVIDAALRERGVLPRDELVALIEAKVRHLFDTELDRVEHEVAGKEDEKRIAAISDPVLDAIDGKSALRPVVSQKDKKK